MARPFSFAAALVLFTVLIMSGCSSNGHDINIQDNHFHQFTGELLSVVDQRENNEPQSFNGDYTVTVTKAFPELNRFQEYSQSNGADDYFYISEHTHIYRLNSEGSKSLISPAELEAHRGKKIEFWVSPFSKAHWILFAVEVTVLE